MTGLARIPAAAWAALAGAALSIWLFYPGFVSFDTAHQWYQVRHGEYSTHHPPLMALMWSLSEPLLPGPGGPFLAQTALYWTSLAVIALALFRQPMAQVAAVLGIGLAPPLFGLLGHVWKDVALMAWLLVACAALIADRRQIRPRRALLALALLALALVGALRHNGLAAALPLVAYIGWRWLGGVARPRVWLPLSALLFVTVAVLSQLPARHPRVESVQFWSTLALWDISAVSIAEGHVLIPESLRKRPFTVADLSAHFRPDVNTTLFDADLFKVGLFEPYTEEESRQLLHAWLSLPLRYPSAYSAHRLRLARSQIGLPGPGMPAPQAFMPGHVALGDNPAIHVPDLAIRTQVIATMRAATGRIWVAAWPWLLVSVALAVHLWRRRSPLGLAVVASGWCYALPLLVLAASTELRYLSATLAAIGIATLLALSHDRQTI